MTFSRNVMADTRSPEQRRRIMQSVKTRDQLDKEAIRNYRE
jgi:hypothetical protein